jgi:exonuclease SbcC
MIPKRLRLAGFLSYRDPVELDFTTFDLACISGPNGAGKSSLLDAITWVLFGIARKNDDSLINSSAQACEVLFEFEYEGNTYRIQRTKSRGKATVLEFSIKTGLAAASGTPGGKNGGWKALTGKSVRETEEYIRKTLRMDYETFTNASFFLQGKADQFAQQRPGDRKRILSSILGLDAWDTYQKRATELRKNLEGEVANLDGSLREITAELNEGPSRQVRLAELEESLARLTKARLVQSAALDNVRKLTAALYEQRRLVDTLQHQAQAAAQNRERTTTLLAARQEERQGYLAQIQAASDIEAAYQAWQSARQALEQMDATAARFRQQDQRRAAPQAEIMTERARLEQEQRGLTTQQQQAAALQAEIPGLHERSLQAQISKVVLKNRIEHLSGLETEIIQLQQDQADAKAENPRLKKEMDELKKRISQLSKAEGALCPVCGQPLGPLERNNLIEELNVQGRSLGDRFRLNQALLKDFDARLAAMKGELAGSGAAQEELRQIDRLLDQIASRLEGIHQAGDAWQTSGELRLREIMQQLAEESYAPVARAQLAAIDAELRAIGYDPAAHERIRRAELDGRASEMALRALETARAALAPLEREVANLEKQAAEQGEDAARQQAAYDQAAAGYAAAEAGLPDLNQAEDDLHSVQEQENRLRMEVGAARQKVDVLERLRARQKELDKSREDKTRRIARLKTLERAFSKDGVPALLIEQALPEIEVQANELLDRLSGGNMSVTFATQRDYKDKNRDDKKETLDIRISDGAGQRDYEMFSGGEAFRVNFAIRLALSKVLAQRAGARLQTLVIDEGFGSQDAEGRQRLIEAINLVKGDFSKVLVITHLDELKEAFPNRIEVEKTLRGSTVTVI